MNSEERKEASRLPYSSKLLAQSTNRASHGGLRARGGKAPLLCFPKTPAPISTHRDENTAGLRFTGDTSEVQFGANPANQADLAQDELVLS